MNRLCCGTMDPGLRRDDNHTGACAQLDYTLLRRDDVASFFVQPRTYQPHLSNKVTPRA
jgi:hypothetical protein